jgi:outer membrane lipoprotein-sorting protein
MRLRIALLGLGLAAVALSTTRHVAAQDLDGEHILRHCDRDNRSHDERAVVEMILEDEQGQRQTRTMEILGKTGEGEDDMNLMRFLTPATVRGTAVLTIEATGRADDQWLFLPALHKSKRIASTQRTQRFAGTDFTYEDLRSENFAANRYVKKDDAQVTQEGKQIPCFVVEATATDPESSGYGKRTLYVDKARFLVLKVEFTDRQGQPLKTLESRDWEQVQNLWRSRTSLMTDVQRHTKTGMRFTERQINPGLPDTTFTEANLERGS